MFYHIAKTATLRQASHPSIHLRILKLNPQEGFEIVGVGFIPFDPSAEDETSCLDVDKRIRVGHHPRQSLNGYWSYRTYFFSFQWLELY